MMTLRLITQLRAQRQSWVELEPGKQVQIMRPAETDIGGLLRAEGGAGRSLQVGLPEVSRFVTGWQGITEADLLGPTVGASDLVPFDAALWAEVVADRADWLGTVAAALLAAVVKHFEAKEAAEKN
jgi:hypothetical protein